MGFEPTQNYAIIKGLLTKERNAMKAPTTFQFTASLYTIPSIRLLSTDLKLISDELLKQITVMPKFFSNAPVVIDLATLRQLDLTIDFKALVKIMREFGLIPVGVKGGHEAHNTSAIGAGLGVFPENKAVEPKDAPLEKIAQKEANSQRKTLIIKEQVRSGVQIYAKDSDLIVLAPVSPGAEVLADGNIHIYAALRGSAHAGIKGDTSARIFCKKLDAERVSIAGHLFLSDEINMPKKDSGMTQLFLENDTLQASAH